MFIKLCSEEQVFLFNSNDLEMATFEYSAQNFTGYFSINLYFSTTRERDKFSLQYQSKKLWLTDCEKVEECFKKQCQPPNENITEALC